MGEKRARRRKDLHRMKAKPARVCRATGVNFTITSQCAHCTAATILGNGLANLQRRSGGSSPKRLIRDPAQHPLVVVVFVASPGMAEARVGVPFVVDGDTIEIHEQRIRLTGLNGATYGFVRRSVFVLDGPLPAGERAEEKMTPAERISFYTILSC